MESPTYITKSGIAVYSTGEAGTPIVVIPGGPGASSKLYRRYLIELASKRKLIFWDYRGTGRSKEIGSHGFNEDHKDLLEVIDSLSTDKISLLAHSYGGVHALKFASEKPTIVQDLILVSTSPSFIDSSRTAQSLKRKNIGEKDFTTMASTFGKIAKANYPKEMADTLSAIEAKNQLLNPSPQSIKEFVDDSELNYRSVRETAGWVELNSRVSLPKITARTLVLASEQDIVVPPRYSQEISSTIPNAQLIMFQQSRHWSFWEENKTFITIVSDFLR